MPKHRVADTIKTDMVPVGRTMITDAIAVGTTTAIDTDRTITRGMAIETTANIAGLK